MRNGLAVQRERTVNIACLLSTVCHRLLFWPLICLRYDHVKRQTQRGSQTLRKMRHEIGVSQRRNAGHPSRCRRRAPIANHLRAGRDEIVGEVSVMILALPDETAPTSITPNA